MNAMVFKEFCKIAYDKGGISIKSGKEALISARVAKRVRSLGVSGEQAYLDFLKNDTTDDELVNFLDAISTNFTFFFREKDHFELLARLVKEWKANGQKQFKFWSAASSSGEEPYSIAITLLQAFNDPNIKFKILATDISTKILRTAITGEYSEEKIKPCCKMEKTKYFERIGKRSDEERNYMVKQFVKDHLVFKRFNLSVVPFPMKGPLDVVFCRNVMIYFDKIVRQKLVSEIERLLKPGGYLIIGHTETLTGIKTGLQVVRPSVYRKE